MGRLLILTFLAAAILEDVNSCAAKLKNWNIREKSAIVPIVTWHGINNNAAGNMDVVNAVLDTLPDAYIYNVMVGDDNDIDEANSVLMRARDQIEYVCEKMKADPLLADGYNALGISQGGLLIRGLVQLCPEVPVKNLITFGAPANGIFGVPDCEHTTGSYELCELVRQLLSAGAYEPWLQGLVTPAQYWRDPLNHTNFLEGSTFLADLNNFKEEKNEDYKNIISNLENLVAIMWEDDETIIPTISSHFGFYVMGQDNLTEPLQETDLYKEDWLGLKILDESGRLQLLSIPGGHMHFDWDWFRDNIVLQYLA